MSTGIEARHARSCGSRNGDKCSCTPRWQASAYDKRAGKRVRKTFQTKSAAKQWRTAAQHAIRAGELSAERGPKLQDAMVEWLKAMEHGHEENRSGDRYKPSTVVGYRQALRQRVWPTLGDYRIGDVTPKDVQGLVEKLKREGWKPATIDGAVTPLKAFYRRAVLRGEVARNPALQVIKPAVRSGAKEIASASEVQARLAALTGEDRTLWALAFYSGLRRGEMIGLAPGEVDLAGGEIRVRRGWDLTHGAIAPKSRRGVREVPIPAALRDHLDQHLLEHGHRERLFRSPQWVARATRRAHEPWKKAGLKPITLHVARHTFASLMIAAGVRPDTLCDYMGHANYQVTVDTYRHLLPNDRDKAAELFDAYLAREITGSTAAPTAAHAGQPA